MALRARRAAPDHLRCLLVDDQMFDRKFMRRAVEKSGVGAECAEAANIAKAREHMARHKADLILLDQRLPDGQGVDWARELQGDPRFARTPVVIVTTYDQGALRSHAA